jgi:PilZ domain
MADSTRGQRLGARARVDRPADVIVEQTKRFGRRVEVAHGVMVHDVSVSGASLLLGSDLQPSVGQVLQLSIDGFRGRVRVRWIRDETGLEDGADGLVFGVEFLDGGPAFLPTVNEWLDQEAVFHTPPHDLF